MPPRTENESTGLREAIQLQLPRSHHRRQCAW